MIKNTDFDQVKDKIAAKIVGAEKNEKLLSQRPHTMVDDLAVTYCVMLHKNEQEVVSEPITNELLSTYGISLEELHETAIQNMDSLMPGSFKSMWQVMKEKMLPDMIAQCDGNVEIAQKMVDTMFPPDSGNLYVLTNEPSINGASVVLNDKFMDEVAEKVGDQFYILPSSIHELLVVPKDAGLGRNELEQMVQEVNATEVAPEERLSDHVYVYDAVNHELYRADREESRVASKEAEKNDVSKDDLKKESAKPTQSPSVNRRRRGR